MTILNKLQNYPWTDTIIKSLLQGTFIQNDNDLRTYQRRGYKTDFENKKGKLFYKPLNLEVVPSDKPDEIRRVLEEVYNRPEATGKGQNQFHQYILQHYLGIKRKNVIEFLNTKPEYQMRQTKTRLVSKGIQATRPFQYWAIDLVDMNFYDNIRANRKHRYIFSCLDIFTKFAWFIPIKKKEAKDIVVAFKKILQYNLRFSKRNSYDYPNYIVSDQGSEFRAEFEAYLKEHNVVHKTTSSYSPQPNIENLNGQLRMMMRANFIKTDSLNWLDYIQDFADSKNTNRDGATGKTPLELMKLYFTRGNTNNIKDTNNSPSTNTLQEVAERVRTVNQARFNKFYKQENFQIGDKVRVKMASFQSGIRKKMKEGTQKLVVVRFSPDIYEIQSIRPVPEGQFGYTLYYLKDNQDRLIRYKNNNPRPFNMGDLLKVSQTTPKYIDLTRANYLNRIPDGQDLYIEPPVTSEFLSESAFVKTPAPAPIKKPIETWKSKEWTDELKGKEFTDYDNIRSKILKIEYSRTYKKYVVDYRQVSSSNKNAQTLQEELGPILDLSRGEDWFIPPYETWIDK